MKKIINVGLLLVTYCAMVIACVLLNRENIGADDNVSMIINVTMFVIVGIIFAWAIFSSLMKINKITKELNKVANNISDEYEQEQKYLLEKYCKEGRYNLFENKELNKLYGQYLTEITRLSEMNQSNFKCDIEDYINYEWLDYTAKKNLLNLVPGAMTGMGILGTFIGLSVGLENFNTGTAAEIESSIPPLMEGIKVAFHTSVFGMIFSLVFNMVYKSILENAYHSLDSFLEVFNRCVCSDVGNDNFSRLLDGQKKQYEILSNPVLTAVQTMSENIALMLELQRKQFDEVKQIPGVMEGKIGNVLANVISPQFERMNENLHNFEKSISEAQIDSIGKLVDQFVHQMNGALNESFINLKETISDTCKLQRENSDYMQGVLEKVGSMTTDIQEINELSVKTITSLAEYVVKMEELQSVINQSYEKANVQLDKKFQMDEIMQSYIAQLVAYEREITEAVKDYSKEMGMQVALLGKAESDLVNHSKDNIEMLKRQSEEYSSTFTEATKQQLKNVLELAEDFKSKTAAQILFIMENVKSANSQIVETADTQMKKMSDMTEEQMEKVNKVAEARMIKMNEITDTQMTKMNEITDTQMTKMNEITDTQMTKMNEITDTQMTKLNENTNKFKEHLENQVQLVTGMVSGTEKELLELVKMTNNQVLELTDQQMKNITSLSSAYGEDIKKKTELLEGELEQRSKEAVEFSKNQTLSMKEIAQEFTDSLNKQVDTVVEATVKSEEKISEVTKQHMQTVVTLATDYKENLCKQLNVLNEETEKKNKQIEESSKMHMEQMSACVKSFNDNLTTQLNTILNQIALEKGNVEGKSVEQIQKVMDMSAAFQKEVSEKLKAIHTETEKNIKLTTDMTKNYIESLNDMILSVETDMEKAAKELNKTSDNLNNCLEQKVKKTFDIFDRELSDIASHLSGTIGEVNSTTARVPKVVAEAYETMGKSFEKMQKEMEMMLQILAEAKKNVPVVAVEMEKEN